MEMTLEDFGRRNEGILYPVGTGNGRRKRGGHPGPTKLPGSILGGQVQTGPDVDLCRFTANEKLPDAVRREGICQRCTFEVL